jgi:hypothetical protein
LLCDISLTMSRSHRARLFSPILWAFLCALAIRVALPAGIMVSAEGAQGPVVVLCSGAGVYEAVLDGDGKPTPVHHHGSAAHEHGACPFAGGHAYTPPADPAPAAPAAFAWRDQTVAPPPVQVRALGLRAPPPPSHAPPSLFA